MSLSPSQEKQARKQIEKQNEIINAYRRKFGGGDVESRLMIEDLEKLCYFREPVFDELKPDPLVTVFRDGLRAVLLHIKTMSTAKNIDVDARIQEINKNETDQIG